ncbi:3-oxoacyl-ACP reductase FabG [Aneurinibacillus sp. Ricciae_BoGa-3]|uniref:3-oxoacyl-ACP reductase FabG n=1 Tax=Aneurinibacillus sp. Ricciae_BoGa-3 TaxID=3022697 RepID=UPI00233F8C29|nr:3-oxoacyl-ACP reductase FabG [Aneurinibacillus sp. Ricciae_BoGa-3]WCK52450.1 3-oxoacyl-ACP reductase FabG [Aneurinibacillus sp. Ricciae_BoGa-3]
MGRLNGRVAVVTGAGRGIGKAIALCLGNEGAAVCLLDNNEEMLMQAQDEIKQAGCKSLAIKADVTNWPELEQAFLAVHQFFGSVDILVNNAGVIRDNLFYKMSENDWDVVMEVHLKGAFYCSQIAQKYMVEQGYGRIINISSTSALGNRGQANYSTAKAGLQGLTKTLAIELGKYGITVNAIAPGFIESEMTRATAARLGVDFDDMIKSRIAEIAVRRSGKPEDIANAALFFAQDTSSFVSGQVLYVAGGPKA